MSHLLDNWISDAFSGRAASIPGPADRFNQIAMTAQLSPQRHDMAVHGMIRHRVVVALNGRDDFLSREHRPSLCIKNSKSRNSVFVNSNGWPSRIASPVAG